MLANKWKFEQMEISAKTALLVFREQMEIRTNGNLPAALSLQKTKWKTRRPRSGHFVCFLSYTTLLVQSHATPQSLHVSVRVYSVFVSFDKLLAC